MNLPGFRLHQLSGQSQGYYAVSVSDNWRVTFQFDNGHATDVDYLDYHSIGERKMPMHNPPHPGEIVKYECLERLV